MISSQTKWNSIPYFYRPHPKEGEGNVCTMSVSSGRGGGLHTGTSLPQTEPPYSVTPNSDPPPPLTKTELPYSGVPFSGPPNPQTEPAYGVPLSSDRPTKQWNFYIVTSTAPLSHTHTHTHTTHMDTSAQCR